MLQQILIINSYNIICLNMNNQQVERVKCITLLDNKNKQEKYMLSQKILGKGKYGQVHRAVNINDHDKVFAVKVIKFESQKIRKDYLKQLQIIKHLPKSLHLVKIHSQHFESNNNFYLFQQYCDGGNLLQYKLNRKGNPFTQDQVYNIFYQIVNGFLDMRRSNIFHEDIKPQNILIKNNIFKFTDFGISQIGSKVQASELRKGTLVYMPPQKLKGNTFIPTSKSQIYSLGITLYEVIFGSHPYLRKKPTDYKHYLRMLQEAQLKSADQLKKNFPSHSLCIDKLIRTILKMIELNDSKRLSLQQLQDYMKNTQPFKSMIVTEMEPMAKKRNSKQIKYQVVGHSKVMLQSQGGLGSLICCKQISNQQSQKQKTQIIDLCKVSLQLFRDASGYFQQGLVYSKQSKLYQMTKIQKQSVISLNNIVRSNQIEFMVFLFIEKMFVQFERTINNNIFQLDGQINSFSNVDAHEDKEFISNQLLKIYMQIQVQQKKGILTSLKQQGSQLALIIAQQLQLIFSLVDCVKVNFKCDMLTVLFIKDAPFVFRYIKLLLDAIIQNSIQKICEILGYEEYNKVKKIIYDFNAIQMQKKQKVRQNFLQKMKGHTIIEDIQSNSDEFQVLDLADIQ